MLTLETPHLSHTRAAPAATYTVALLGCEVATELLDAGDVCTGASFWMDGLVEAHGGPPLHGMVLTESMFVATEMVAGGEVV